jgi:uracil-DNA glycosylase
MLLPLNLPAPWHTVVAWSPEDPNRCRLEHFLGQQQQTAGPIYPPDPFAALRRLAPSDVRVVILGQDPYHGPDQANGLAFSVRHGQKLPPSLRNIFKELVRDGHGAMPAHGDLGHWVEQGVLLLNTVLTVAQGLPGSHAGQGWEALTDAVILHVAADPAPKVFMLWGAHAQAKRRLIDTQPHRHRVLACNHPSPLSARRGPMPFLGAGHFSECNRYLVAHRRTPVQWLSAEGLLDI